MRSTASDKKIVALAVAMIAIILIGEATVYTSGTHNYSADADLTVGGVDYTVTSSGSKVFDIIVTDNGGRKPISELYVYYDESYRSDYRDVVVAVGARALDQEYYIQQLVNALEYRGLKNITMVNAVQLASHLGADVAGGPYSKGLVVISGALPDTVYTGNATDTILRWIGGGGSLYWAGNLVGAEYSTRNSIVPVTSDYQTLFLGAQCLNTIVDEGDPAYTDQAFSDIKANGYRDDLSLMNNRVRYAVDTAKLSAKTSDYMAAGYGEKSYASITFVKNGDGMVCVMGGDYSNNQRSDLAQVIAAGLCYSSEELAHHHGIVPRGTTSGTLQASLPASGNVVVYTYIGGYFSVYGKAEFFQLP